jgi:hypothetical protein
MRSYVYGTVRDTQRSAIYVVRVKNDVIDPIEADDIAELMREKIRSRGESATDVVVVVVQGNTKETLRLHGAPHAVARVRAAMFNAAISWRPVELD